MSKKLTWKRHKGALFIEYALILAFVIVAGLVFLTSGGTTDSVSTVFSKTASELAVAVGEENSKQEEKPKTSYEQALKNAQDVLQYMYNNKHEVNKNNGVAYFSQYNDDSKKLYEGLDTSKINSIVIYNNGLLAGDQNEGKTADYNANNYTVTGMVINYKDGTAKYYNGKTNEWSNSSNFDTESKYRYTSDTQKYLDNKKNAGQ